MDNENIESYITMPSGFKAAGVACCLASLLGPALEGSLFQ